MLGDVSRTNTASTRRTVGAQRSLTASGKYAGRGVDVTLFRAREKLRECTRRQLAAEGAG